MPPGEPAGGSLRSIAVRGAVWTVSGVAASQALRLGSNAIITRLLEPDAFGLMAIVAIFTTALATFSDLGISAAIVQHRRGEDPVFVNTAWTLQIARGVVIFLGACLLAWPVSLFYGEAVLRWALPVAAVAALISGFDSTALATLNRRLVLGRLTALDLLSQVTSVAVMVAWAWRSPTLWALVFGGLAATVVRTVLSHTALPGIRPRLCWDPTARRELMRFGRWIFVSTAFSFVASQGDRFVLSAFVPIATIGIYYVAAQLAQAVMIVCGQLSQRVLFPLYTRLAERSARAELLPRQRRIRMLLMAAILPVPCALIAFGDQVVGLLLGARFAAAGPMLQLLSVGIVFEVITATVAPVVLASGDSYSHMVLLIARGTLMTLGALVGASTAGVDGLILGIVGAQIASYPVLAWAVAKHGAWTPWLDLAGVGYAATVAALLFGARQAIG